MTPISQTILHDPENGKHGNCFSAVLASLLHLNIDDVPVFSNPKTWRVELNIWLRQYGLAFVDTNEIDLSSIGIEGLHHEIHGTTSRHHDVLHACCAIDGATNFDPHPTRRGLEEVEGYGIFIPLRPWEWVK